MAITIDTLDRLKSQLLTSGIQDKNQALFQIINLLIDAVRQGFGQVNTQVFTPSSGGGPGGISAATVLTYGDEIASFPNSSRVLAGAGIQFNKNGAFLTISAAIPFPMDGQDGKDGDIGPPGIQGIPGPPGPIGPPGMDAMCECEAIPFIGNSINGAGFTQLIP